MNSYENRYYDLPTFLTFAIVLLLVTVIGIVFSGPKTSAGEMTPETEVVETIVENTECTTAPVIDIIPETTENIHIEVSEMPSEALSASVSDETYSDMSMTELEMLACVIYQEAGGDGSCDDCRRYVADIVLNRIASPEFPNTMYEVLTEESQYGMFHWTGIKWADRAKNPGEANAVARAYRIAEEVLNGQHSKLFGEGYIWQARHVQGSEGFECCGHWYGR